MLSAGTRVDILVDNNVEWEKPGDVISHGYITVRLRSKPTFKLRENQPNMPADGIFDIEADYVTIVRPRVEEAPANPRWKRRHKKAQEYHLRQLTQKSQEFGVPN